MVSATESINIGTATSILMQVLVFVIITLLWKKLQDKTANFRAGTLKIDNVIGFELRPTEILNAFARYQDAHPNICKLWYGFKPLYLISKPEYFKIIFTSPVALHKITLYKYILEVFNFGILVAPVPLWRRHRKVINPTFGKNVVNTFVDRFYNQAAIFNDDISKHVGETDCNVKPLLIARLMKTSLDTIFAIDADSNVDVIVKHLERVTDVIACRTLNPLYQPYIIFRLSSMYKHLQDSVENMLRFGESLLMKKQRKLKEEANYHDSQIINGKPIRRPFLDHVLINSDFTLEEVREEFFMFFLTSMDSLVISLQCLMTVLGIHQDVQDKMYNEIIDVVDSERPIIQGDLAKLEYTDRVIKESLRLFPIGPLIGRDLSEDLDLGDVILPKGSNIVINILHMHRNPEIWKDPLKFDPDRFLPDNVAKRHPCSYVPFAYGPRNCIGKEYAMTVMKIFIGSLVRKFRIYSEYGSISDVRLKFNMVLRLTDGPKVSFEYRK